MRCSLSASAFAALWLGCSDPPATPARDAGGDGSTADKPATVPDASVRCVSDRECSARAQVCSATLGMCVECNATRDCTDGRTCLGSRCVAATACTTSRMCPGQVCAMSLGVCVDCERDVDCSGGMLCRANACVAPPRPCRSSRECSDIGQVCAPVRGHCVDCVLDSDCPMGSYCGAELACLVRACVPNTSTCAGPTRVRRCNAVGSAATESDCPAGQTCSGTSCQASMCTPGQVSCDPMSAARRVCAADGGGYTPMPCPAGMSCAGGACSAEATFRVDALAATGCASVAHGGVTGDDRGGIALSSSHVFVNGDTTLGIAALPSFDGGVRGATPSRVRDTLIHDVATGTVYTFVDAMNREINSPVVFPGTATHLGVLEGATAILTSTRVPLSMPLPVSAQMGFFSGRGRAYVVIGSSPATWYQISLPGGVVTMMHRAETRPSLTSCEAGHYYGVAEYFGGEAYAVFAASSTRVVRYRIRDDRNVADLLTLPTPGLANMCSLAVSPAHNRWYFTLMGASFVGGSTGVETLGACGAMTSTP